MSVLLYIEHPDPPVFLKNTIWLLLQFMNTLLEIIHLILENPFKLLFGETRSQ